MRAFATLLLVCTTGAQAAPAPDPEIQAQKQLARLAGNLPEALKAAWQKNPYRTDGRTTFNGRELHFRRARMLSATEAKVSVRFTTMVGSDEYVLAMDLLLRYYQGRWTAIPAGPVTSDQASVIQSWLAQVIDDAAE